MTQPEFLWFFKHFRDVETTQKDDEITAVLRPAVSITHNYKRRGQEMLITLGDDNSEYVINNRSQLEDICKMHLENKNIMTILHEYCHEHLNKIEY